MATTWSTNELFQERALGCLIRCSAFDFSDYDSGTKMKMKNLVSFKAFEAFRHLTHLDAWAAVRASYREVPRVFRETSDQRSSRDHREMKTQPRASAPRQSTRFVDSGPSVYVVDGKLSLLPAILTFLKRQIRYSICYLKDEK